MQKGSYFLLIIRTDLALESKQYVKTKVIDGIICDEQTQNNIKTTRIKIVNSNGSKLLSKPLGTYVTIEYQKYDKQQFKLCHGFKQRPNPLSS